MKSAEVNISISDIQRSATRFVMNVCEWTSCTVSCNRNASRLVPPARCDSQRPQAADSNAQFQGSLALAGQIASLSTRPESSFGSPSPPPFMRDPAPLRSAEPPSFQTWSSPGSRIAAAQTSVSPPAASGSRSDAYGQFNSSSNADARRSTGYSVEHVYPNPTVAVSPSRSGEQLVYRHGPKLFHSDRPLDAALPLASVNQPSRVRNRLVTTDFINAGLNLHRRCCVCIPPRRFSNSQHRPQSRRRLPRERYETHSRFHSRMSVAPQLTRNRRRARCLPCSCRPMMNRIWKWTRCGKIRT